MKKIKTVCLVLGNGAAGLTAGISFLGEYSKKSDVEKCVILGPKASNSRISPWNIMNRTENEVKELIWNTGNQLSNPEVLEFFSKNHYKSIEWLKNLGVPLKESNIGFVPKISGAETIGVFERRFLEKGGKYIDGYAKNFLVNSKGLIRGVIASTAYGNAEIAADQIIIAGGGLTNLYEYTTGYSIPSVPNLLALSLEAGLEIENLEFNMFHPFLIIDKRFPRALVSGEILQKARYIDEKGNEFLSEKISDALRNNKHHSLFPQMTQEFYIQSQKSRIFMDISGVSEEYFQNYKKENEFGWIFKGRSLKDSGRFEIHPAFHYSIGGIKINSNAETNEKNVYAAGEITSGLHGSSRIGGFAVSEALVFGETAGRNAARNSSGFKEESLAKVGNCKVNSKLKKIFWDYLGPIKKRAKLKELESELRSKSSLCSEEKLVLKMIGSSLQRGSLGTNFIA